MEKKLHDLKRKLEKDIKKTLNIKRDRIREGEEERQRQIDMSNVQTPDSTPDVPWAHSRNEAPGAYGGHV